MSASSPKSLTQKSTTQIIGTGELASVDRQIHQERTVFFSLIIFGILCGLGILTFLAKRTPYFGFDLVITREVQEFHAAWFNLLMVLITTIGYAIPGVVLTLTASAFFLLRQKKLVACMTLLSTGGAGLIALLMKTVIARPRPSANVIYQWQALHGNDSFPSGHVLFYIGLFGFLLYIVYALLPHSFARRALILLFSVLLILIGPSRIYLGAHWFSDVLGAYLVGFLWLVVVIFIYIKLKARFVDRL